MKDFLDYVVKNKYVIICVSIVVVLYALGIVEFLTRAVILAIFVGKKLQDNEGKVKNIFDYFKNKEYKNNVYYYQSNDNNNNEKK